NIKENARENMSTSQRDQELLCEFVRKSSTCVACKKP
ncbi:hypothetical protein KR222_007805, partial [Zaprionus bogoriensis]